LNEQQNLWRRKESTKMWIKKKVTVEDFNSKVDLMSLILDMQEKRIDQLKEGIKELGLSVVSGMRR